MVAWVQEEAAVKCVICKGGETEPGHTTLTLERDTLVLVVKDVPALVCQVCGEAYVDEATTEGLLELADDMSAAGTLVDVRRFAAA